MRSAKKKPTGRKSPRIQLNIRIERSLYQTLKAVARQEQRSVPQTARQLVEHGLRQRMNIATPADDTSAQEIAALATEGGAFDWLDEEPDLYDDSCGEPV